MLLVGYDEKNYYFNDPYDNNGVIGYTKEIVERRHAAQHSMALGVIEEKRLKFTKTYFTNRKISAIVYLGYSKYVMIADRKKCLFCERNHTHTFSKISGRPDAC